MSLLADLLAKIKPENKEGGVPPNLAHAISDLRNRRVLRRRLVFAGVAVFLLVLAGFGAIRYFSTLSGPSFSTKVPDANTPRAVGATPSSTTAVLSQPVQRRETGPSPIGPSIETKQAATAVEKVKPEPGHSATVETPLKKATKTRQIYETYTEDELKSGEKGEPYGRRAGPSKELLMAEKDSLLYTARGYEDGRDYEQALLFYKKALALDEANYAIMSNMAGTLIKAGRFEEAMKYSRESLEMNKNYTPALINLGIAMAQSGRSTEGKTFLSKALALEPSNGYALLNLGILFEKGKDFAEAEKVYGKLTRLGNAQGDFGSARLAENSGKNEDAKRIYRRILAMSSIDSATRELAMTRLGALESR
jgi:hypothetical protein